MLIGFGVSISRAHPKFGHTDTAKEILAASTQKQLEHG
ncbi:hypothetical protein BF49_2594 [Bradyrhizobium sp.]|jgi:hypothetical protein|nr:hypothetical protein BF49_2594 [Bradyrhizobium sp.]